MRASTAAVSFAIGLALTQLSSCGEGSSSGPGPAHPPLSSSLDLPLLQGVAPAQAFHSDRVELTLELAGVTVPVTSVWIGNMQAAEVRQADLGTAVAVFDAAGEEQVGLHDVTVSFADGTRTKLPNGFRRQFKQDPVVFVHGCPLPKQSTVAGSASLGSVTNYVTSKFWHGIYQKLKAAGYPAPPWSAEIDFLQSPPFDHASTHPAPGNYLNVFVMSEDSRDPEHSRRSVPTPRTRVTAAPACGWPTNSAAT